VAALTFLIFVIVALVAAAFVVGPVLAQRSLRGRYVLAAAGVLLVLGIGGGLYVTLGQPGLALRTLKGSNDHSTNALIGRLAAAVKAHPADPRGWALLGQYYSTAKDPPDAANAFARAIEAAGAQGQRYAFLYSAYGEATAQASAGAVTPDSEAAFQQALALDPKDMAARYYLGLAEAARGNGAQAIAYWSNLLADAPANSALHAELVDRIAALTARGAGGAGGPPNIAAMVAGLAARLQGNPDDPAGWQRLIRAYAVLGDKPRALAALADARKAAEGDGAQLSALDAEARALGL
jgi:cytochrome c-type biogenesis protein CcmH